MMSAPRLAIVLCSLVGFSAGAVSAAEPISYRRQVWPILKRHCWSCHSGKKPGGRLSLTTAEAIQRGGESGRLLVPGKPEESLLIEITGGNEPSMPPKGPPLSSAKIEILRRWIVQGAEVDKIAPPGEARIVIPREYTFPPAITSTAFSPDGSRIACACRSEVVVVQADGKGLPLRLPTRSDLINHVEFSADGKFLLAAGGTPSRYGEVCVFAVADGKQVLARRVGNDTLFRGGFSPDGTRVALGGADGAVYVIPLDAKAKVRRFELHSDWVVDVAWTPDGKKLVTAGRDKATKVASVETGKLLRTVDSSKERMSSVVTDGVFAVSAGKARTLIGYQLDVALQNVSVTGAGNGAKPITRRDQYTKNFEGQPGEVIDIALSGNRKSIAVAGLSTEVRIYSIADRKRTAIATGVRAPVFSVALNGDATLLAVGGQDGQLEVYRLPKVQRVFSRIPVPVRKSVAGKPGR
ncbi:MAG: hypothetical protein CMJ65_08720 [Planctomycetaceae bacterium]|mgnify:CR=1 FL=1|jgi:hypothetical protein|nr:hypothetical protein [Planctomycetaceae bacterium]